MLVAALLVLIAEPLANAHFASAPGFGESLASMTRPSTADAAATLPPYSMHIASTVDRSRAAPVLVVLHGMGSSGQEMIAPFVAEAERYGWVIIAPTFTYRDWTDPDQVRLDELELIPTIRSLIDSLPSRVTVAVESKAIVFGFSRGAQLAHRFAFFYPESVRGVVTAGAGTYTLPRAEARPEQGGQALAFPYGVGDLARYTGRPFNVGALRSVPFMVTVGAQDNRRGDVPRQWDRLLGTTRIERAQAFVESLTEIGVRAELRVVPQTDHEVSSIMRQLGCEFLQSVSK